MYLSNIDIKTAWYDGHDYVWFNILIGTASKAGTIYSAEARPTLKLGNLYDVTNVFVVFVKA